VNREKQEITEKLKQISQTHDLFVVAVGNVFDDDTPMYYGSVGEPWGVSTPEEFSGRYAFVAAMSLVSMLGNYREGASQAGSEAREIEKCGITAIDAFYREMEHFLSVLLNEDLDMQYIRRIRRDQS
jgi:hypothetical protein